MQRSNVLLPLPDSPTMASVSPPSTPQSTPLTISAGPSRVPMRTRKSDSSKRALTGCPAVTRWPSAVAGLVEEGSPEFGRNFIIGRVLTPGETVTLMQTHDRVLVRALREMVASPDTGLRFCYCSIFDDCWLQETQSPTTRPVAVDVCPDYGPRAFRD